MIHRAMWGGAGVDPTEGEKDNDNTERGRANRRGDKTRTKK